MDKRYQVFVSSTYADLKDERFSISQALMKMNCFPAGMELFPAFDEEQFEFIKRIIDESDYYILIIGGRYGSLAKDGIGFTEKEYDYAVSKGMKVLAFLHSDVDNLPRAKTENDRKKLAKLQNFRKKVSTGRLVKFWNDPKELASIVILSLFETVRIYPAIGWIRSNQALGTEFISELNSLKAENIELRRVVSGSDQISDLDDLAALEEDFIINFDITEHDPYDGFNINKYTKAIKTMWKEVFKLISPSLITNQDENQINEYIGKNYFPGEKTFSQVHKIDFDTIKIQFIAHGLIEVENGRQGQHSWKLTDFGKKMMLALRTVKSQKQSSER
jgi:hypothetical protein